MSDVTETSAFQLAALRLLKGGMGQEKRVMTTSLLFSTVGYCGEDSNRRQRRRSLPTLRRLFFGYGISREALTTPTRSQPLVAAPILRFI
jgi:hypothetical protein